MNTQWFLPVLLSATVLGFYNICKKSAVKDNSVMPVLFLATFCGSVFFLLITAFSGNLAAAVKCTPSEYLLTLLKSVIVSASWVCVYYALRELPITLAAPIQVTTSLWTVIGGMLIFHEIPDALQAAGMIIIFIGYLCFNLIGKTEGFNWKSKGLILIVAGALLPSVSALFDKYLLSVRMIDRQVLQFYFSVDLVVLLGAGYLIRRCCGKAHKMVWRWTIPATGMLLVIADYLYFYVLSMDNAPISLVSLVRRSGCAVSFVVGVWLFHDRNVKRKAWALALLFAGIILIAVGKNF